VVDFSCVQGVVANFHAPESLANFEAVVVGSVPLGGGVSSSASLEVAYLKKDGNKQFLFQKGSLNFCENLTRTKELL
jgi:hypothetical protein